MNDRFEKTDPGADEAKSFGVNDGAARPIEDLLNGESGRNSGDEHRIRVAIENGIRDSETGRTISVEEVRRRFGLK